ncbi:hypothetical protein O9Z70_05685 [Devosia sp. YIM 151766]|uniref:hypothetical protein n=1 Tax=Devosia sp. YIM 151766 TaxID=3017325 RepID=UPI00255CF754|nr:hypothetical protein [Devosia sp. YIM 151766]WIY54019.1 hypothetical protein O9Z70_05685 [Devosia sp. YIM 151766]
MEQEHMVRDVSVQVDEQIHTATYFVEGGTIHANIGDQSYFLPVGRIPAEETVRSLLIEKLRRKNFRTEMARKWFGSR